MRTSIIKVSALLACLCILELPAAPARMSIEDVRAGMTGIGVTVFDGTKREEFKAEILGVLRNVMGPQRDIIVARLSGGPLNHTGVMQGMSGSPVYIDGQLIGAVSYALGSFPKEPIAGITPIGEMLATDAASRRTVRAKHGQPSFPISAHGLQEIFRSSAGQYQLVSLESSDTERFALSQSAELTSTRMLSPIATPLVFNGFTQEIHNLWESALKLSGFLTAVGSAQASQSRDQLSLQAGDAVGAALIRGDLTMAGTGTVTLVENNRVYAFGHPFYNLGPISFPMTKASVTALLPSLAISSKIAAIGDVIGTLDQDRSTGIFGTLGAEPDVIPVTIRLRGSDRSFNDTFKFEVIRDNILTPLLVYSGALSTFLSSSRQLGAATYTITSSTRVRGHDAVTFTDIYSGNTAVSNAAAAIANPLSILLNNSIATVEITGLEIDATAIEEPLTAAIERIWIDTPRVHPGSIVKLNVLARSYRDIEILETLTLSIPSSATGQIQILVSDASSLKTRPLSQHRGNRTFDNVGQIIQHLNATPRNNRLYVKLIKSSAGAVFNGTQMPDLPPSILEVLEGNRSATGVQRLQTASLGDWEIPTKHAVSGSRTLSITMQTE